MPYMGKGKMPRDGNDAFTLNVCSLPREVATPWSCCFPEAAAWMMTVPPGSAKGCHPSVPHAVFEESAEKQTPEALSTKLRRWNETITVNMGPSVNQGLWMPERVNT